MRALGGTLVRIATCRRSVATARKQAPRKGKEGERDGKIIIRPQSVIDASGGHHGGVAERAHIRMG